MFPVFNIKAVLKNELFINEGELNSNDDYDLRN